MLSWQSYLWVLAFGALLVRASTDSSSNNAVNLNTTSTGDDRVGWVAPNSQRSTWDILWSCLSIFIVCSWKPVHLNLPTAEEARGEWHTLRGLPVFPKRPLLRKWSRKLLWMVIISDAPELGIALAAKQFVAAWKDARGRKEYSLSHAFHAHMGGLVFSELPSSLLDSSARSEPPSGEQHPAIPNDDAILIRTMQLRSQRKPSGENSYSAERSSAPDQDVEPNHENTSGGQQPKAKKVTLCVPNLGAYLQNFYHLVFPTTGWLIIDPNHKKPWLRSPGS